MKKLLIILCGFLSISAIADTKLSIDLSIDKLNFQKPEKGVGKAGTLIFKSANVNNSGIVLNINNVNNYFDSEIFVRPTFLGFTTQFGNFGFPLEAISIINKINKTELQNSKLIFDDNQLNLSGEYFSFFNVETNVKLKNFRLYCQSIENLDEKLDSDAPNDMMSKCLNFLTLNGSFTPENQAATLEYEGNDKDQKTFIQTQINSFDLRKNQINANLTSLKSVRNNSYFITANELNLNCDKDEDLKTVDFDKIKKACLNRLKITPVKVSIVDKVDKSAFNLDVKDVSIKDKIAYLTLNNGSISDPKSATYIYNLLLNIKKDPETDLFDLFQVLKDSISYTRFTVAEIKTTKPDQSDNSVQQIAVSSTNGSLVTSAAVKFLGIKAKVTIYGSIALNESKKQLIITVTDTKLPLGLNSVKLLMYFLKKYIVSKDITIQDNIITIQL